jgi:hypothetical protein
VEETRRNTTQASIRIAREHMLKTASQVIEIRHDIYNLEANGANTRSDILRVSYKFGRTCPHCKQQVLGDLNFWVHHNVEI